MAYYNPVPAILHELQQKCTRSLRVANNLRHIYSLVWRYLLKTIRFLSVTVPGHFLGAHLFSMLPNDKDCSTILRKNIIVAVVTQNRVIWGNSNIEDCILISCIILRINWYIVTRIFLIIRIFQYIRKLPYGFLMFSRGRERVHWERMG